MEHPDKYPVMKGTGGLRKANAAQGIPEMIEIATNGVLEENRKKKHGRDAKNGWYRYDTRFGLPVYCEDGEISGYIIFHARLLIRHAASGKKYLYDVMEIKKKRASPVRLMPYPVKNPFLGSYLKEVWINCQKKFGGLLFYVVS